MHSLPTGSRNNGKNFNSRQAGCFWSYGLFIGIITLSARAVIATYGTSPVARQQQGLSFSIRSGALRFGMGLRKSANKAAGNAGTHVSGNEVNDARNPSEMHPIPICSSLHAP